MAWVENNIVKNKFNNHGEKLTGISSKLSHEEWQCNECLTARSPFPFNEYRTLGANVIQNLVRVLD